LYSDYLPEDNGQCFCRAFGFGEQLSFEIGHLQQQAFAILKILPDDQVDPVNMCLTSQLAAVLRKFGVLPHHPTQGRDRADHFSCPDQHYGRRLSRYDNLKTNPLAKRADCPTIYATSLFLYGDRQVTPWIESRSS
jgi:hypothetical protein